MAVIVTALTAVTFGYERLVERIPPIAKKTIAAIRSVREVWDEIKTKRE
ncbi:hypothetical protein [Streptomyces griseoluteus]